MTTEEHEITCPGCGFFPLAEPLMICNPCQREMERICVVPKCGRLTWIEKHVPMIDRPIHVHCFEHFFESRRSVNVDFI